MFIEMQLHSEGFAKRSTSKILPDMDDAAIDDAFHAMALSLAKEFKKTLKEKNQTEAKNKRNKPCP